MSNAYVRSGNLKPLPIPPPKGGGSAFCLLINGFGRVASPAGGGGRGLNYHLMIQIPILTYGIEAGARLAWVQVPMSHNKGLGISPAQLLE